MRISIGRLFWSFSVFLAVLAPNLLVSPAHAGVFDLPAFVEQGEWAAGLEPEISLSQGTGAALNFKPRYGVNDMLNWQGLIGTGSGARNFRIGFAAGLEWFPDYEGQLGIATPLFTEYYRIETDGLFTYGAKPMLYKTFVGNQASYTPFVSLPIGWNFRNSDNKQFMQIALGSLFKLPTKDHWRFNVEAGFNVYNSYSYLSGGVSYFH